MKLRREEILKALREAGTSLTLEELSQQIGIGIVRLRIDLFRLAEEGKVERKQRGNKTVWSIKVGRPLEQRYEKLSKKYIP